MTPLLAAAPLLATIVEDRLQHRTAEESVEIQCAAFCWISEGKG